MDSLISYKYLTGEKKFDAKAACHAALECAEEGIVLLKNENGALPIQRSRKTRRWTCDNSSYNSRYMLIILVHL